MRRWALTVLACAAWAASASAQTPSVIWGFWAVLPSLPAGLQVEPAQLDGIGAKELIAYSPATGQAWIAWMQRDRQGAPRACYETLWWPPRMTVKVTRLDDWDTRDDVLLVPMDGGVLYAATTFLQQGACYGWTP
jgi:hypothetical protein